MRHITEAYEALIDKQKGELESLRSKLEEETTVVHFLLDFFVCAGGTKRSKSALLTALAERKAGPFEISKAHAMDLSQYVDAHWGTYDASQAQP